MTDNPARMRDHWWWRPGWRPGRRMYTWHFTFNGQTALHDLVTAYQERLTGLDGLDPIPLEWLHLTTQGLGFVDETTQEDVAAVVEDARRRLVDVPPVMLEIGPATIDPEVIRLKVHPVEELLPVRRALREAIAAVRGPDMVMEPEQWHPHVSVAYSNAEGPMAPLADTIADELPPARVRISEVHLIRLGRDEHQYTWTTEARVPLAG